MTYDPSRTYSVGERPTSPIALPTAFIIISDVQDEGIDAETGEHRWSYIQDRIVSVTEYIKEKLG